MGIKFLCPNGHKLNVKSFLRGKRAICPKCGARVLVPDNVESVADEGDTSTELAMATASTDTAVMESGSPPSSSNIAGASTSSASAPPLPLTPETSPIDEAPSAVWYVRPATGGQFGPASGEIMRAWISEGRVGASSLVWRAGWPEWRAASAVFPALGKLLVSPAASATVQAVPQPAIPTAAPVPGPASKQGIVSEVLPPVAHGHRKRRLRQQRTMIASGILLLIVLILMAVLVIVWQNQQSADDVTTEPAEASAAGIGTAGRTLLG